jgi:RNA-directed DNA polymerase
MMRAVRKHTDCRWVLLCLERWLKAPVPLEDDSLIHRGKGTPQRRAISPLLGNLFLHYAFDIWMQKYYPQVPFERYADDGICHCRSKAEVEGLGVAIGRRFAECVLELNLQKTRVVYCQDDDRRGSIRSRNSIFWGYPFRPRRSKDRWGRFFIGFTSKQP